MSRRLKIVCVFVAVASLLGLTSAASSAPKTFSCAITPDPVTLAYPERTFYDVSATVPVSSVPYVLLSGAGAPSNEWTSLHNQHGQVALDPVTTLFTTTGTVTASIVDARKSDPANGVFFVITTCTFTVT